MKPTQEILTPGAAQELILKQRLTELHYLLLRIQPDGVRSQTCKAPHCHGKRGWNEMIVHAETDGSRRYSVGVCCGRIGPTAFEELSDLVKAMNGKLDAAAVASLRSAEVSEAVFANLFTERVRRLWEKVWSRMRRGK